MRLDLQTFLPRFALVKPAKTHDATEAPELCADIRAGEIVVFDKAYIDLAHLHSLDQRGGFWVTRSKDSMACEIVGQHAAPGGRILLDAVVELTGAKSRRALGSTGHVQRPPILWDSTRPTTRASKARPGVPARARAATTGADRARIWKCANTGCRKTAVPSLEILRKHWISGDYGMTVFHSDRSPGIPLVPATVAVGELGVFEDVREGSVLAPAPINRQASGS